MEAAQQLQMISAASDILIFSIRDDVRQFACLGDAGDQIAPAQND
jgi:hypothetical protein